MLCCETTPYLWWRRCKLHPPSMSIHLRNHDHQRPSIVPPPARNQDTNHITVALARYHHNVIVKASLSVWQGAQGRARQGKVRSGKTGGVLFFKFPAASAHNSLYRTPTQANNKTPPSPQTFSRQEPHVRKSRQDRTDGGNSPRQVGNAERETKKN